MTEFFELVKGKKIRAKDWQDGWYFIPDSTLFGQITGNLETRERYSTSDFRFTYWYFVDTPSQCVCSIKRLLNNLHCRCGYFKKE